jgi:hypothetical protein
LSVVVAGDDARAVGDVVLLLTWAAWPLLLQAASNAQAATS